MKVPTEEQIRNRAYEIYLSHGDNGRAEQDWLLAERELTEGTGDDEAVAAIWARKPEKRRKGESLVGAGRSEEYKKGF